MNVLASRGTVAVRRPRARRTLGAVGLSLGAFVLAAPGSTPGAMIPASSTSYLYTGFGSGGEALPVTPATDESIANTVAAIPVCPPAPRACPYSRIAGDIVAAGFESIPAGGTQAVITVVSPTGKLVSAFGGQGIVSSSMFGSGGISGIGVYPPCPPSNLSCPWAAEAGYVVVVGGGSAGVQVAAYDASGSLKWNPVISPAGYTTGSAPAVTLDTDGATPDGDVIVADYAYLTAGGALQPLLAALKPTGVTDTSFGGAAQGVETSNINVGTTQPASEYLTGVAVDSIGDIVVGGTFFDNFGNSSILVARYVPSGALDGKFGVGPANCATTSACSGATDLGTTETSSGIAIEPEPANCGRPACYNALVVSTSTPTNGTASTIVVGAVNETGAKASNFGGGLVSIPGSRNGSTGSGITVQAVGATVSAVMVSGYTSGTASAAGSATISRLTGAGGVLSSFGSGGTFTIPSTSSLTIDPEALAVAPIPGTLDFVVAGALAGPNDSVPRFGLARVLGEVVQVTARASRDTRSANSDFLTITLTPTAPPPSAIGINYALRSPTGESFSSSGGTATIPARANSYSFNIDVYFPGLTGSGSINLATSPAASGLSSITSPTAINVAPVASPFGVAPPPGYWMITNTGGVYTFKVPYHGALGSLPPAPIVGMAEIATGNGYWLTTSTGIVYPFGVTSRGEFHSKPPSPIVAIAADSNTGGYWLFARNGAVYGFDAPNYGQGTSVHLSGPVTGAAAAPDGRGYWLVTSPGSIYGFGPGAHYYGSAAIDHPSAPVVSIAADPHTGGYWVVTGNGAVYGFNAPYYGAPTGQSPTSITPDPGTTGYWVSLANGGVYSFGAKFYGSATPDHPHGPVIAMVGR